MAEVSNLETYLKELTGDAKDPIHKRLIAAYKGDNPKEHVEAELDSIMLEVISRED